jgi:hypothetical protein
MFAAGVERGLLESLFPCTASRALQRQHLSFWIRQGGFGHIAPHSHGSRSSMIGPASSRVERKPVRSRWLDDWTILKELLVVWLVIVQPPLAAFWVLRERKLRRPDADGPD